MWVEKRDDILVIYCCVTDYPHIYGLRQQAFIISKFLWVRHPSVASPVACRSRSLMMLKAGCWPNCSQVAASWKHYLLNTRALFRRETHTWLPTSFIVNKQEREPERKPQSFCYSFLPVTSYQLCYILFIRSKSPSPTHIQEEGIDYTRT